MANLFSKIRFSLARNPPPFQGEGLGEGGGEPVPSSVHHPNPFPSLN